MSDILRRYYLQVMGIDLWLSRQSSSACTDTSSVNNLSKLEHEVAVCTRCPLHETRTQTVFSRGNSTAKLMLIGEAPGFYEDQQG